LYQLQVTLLEICGTGLRTFASGKITTTNNIILGPSDEYIPSPDIYDSDYNSVNFTVERGVTFNSPVLLYIQDGSAKDISSTKVAITAGIGTIVNAGLSSETLGTKFISFNIPTTKYWKWWDKQTKWIYSTEFNFYTNQYAWNYISTWI